MDIRSLLDAPWVYRCYQALVGGPRSHRLFVQDFVRPFAGMRVLDIGCGPGDILDHLHDVEYRGLDASPGYVATARLRHGRRASFSCQQLSEADAGEPASYDLVIAHGLLHHLDDADARRLFRLAWAALRPGGRCCTLDGVFADRQSSVARWLIAHDRGRHVRTEPAYRAIARTAFPDVISTVRHDMMHIPYTLLIMECRKPA
jgi:SAM-dependent methyltransferase